LTFYIQIINIIIRKPKKTKNMAKKTYVPALDGVRGIMPGILTLNDVEFEDDVEPTSAPRIKEEFHRSGGENQSLGTHGG
jgi:hypothetical protein